MRLGVAVLLIFGFFGFGKKQDDPSSKPTVSPAIGLQVGQQAPTFTAHDQFGHLASNETLRGVNGTILLFFRSADW
jgi:hypothetical protein